MLMHRNSLRASFSAQTTSLKISFKKKSHNSKVWFRCVKQGHQGSSGLQTSGIKAAPLSFNSSQQSFSHADRWAISRVYLLISAFSFFRVTPKDPMMTGWTGARWCYSRTTHQWINCWKSRRHWGISLIYESGSPNISRIYYFQAHITHP